jgi:hypothetical protein
MFLLIKCILDKVRAEIQNIFLFLSRAVIEMKVK